MIKIAPLGLGIGHFCTILTKMTLILTFDLELDRGSCN